MEYTDKMQSFITKTTIDIVIIFSLIAIIIALVWISMLIYYKKRKMDKNGLKYSLIGSILLTLICLLFSLTTISSFQDINNMKKDIENQSFVTYIGDYDIDNNYHFSFSISELWFDLRTVTIENDSEPLWFDMMSDIDIDVSDTGTIVYGKNSRFIVKIESDS